MYYLIYEQEWEYKPRIASILNNFESDAFYTHLVSLLAKEFLLYSRYCTTQEI